MKKEKPQGAIEWLRGIEMANDAVPFLLAFLDSLPDSFTVLEEVWPKELTRERVELMAMAARAYKHTDLEAHSRALAAIAPGPRKRRVTLWESVNGQRQWFDAGTLIDNDNWAKVGECEIEEG